MERNFFWTRQKQKSDVFSPQVTIFNKVLNHIAKEFLTSKMPWQRLSYGASRQNPIFCIIKLSFLHKVNNDNITYGVQGRAFAWKSSQAQEHILKVRENSLLAQRSKIVAYVLATDDFAFYLSWHAFPFIPEHEPIKTLTHTCSKTTSNKLTQPLTTGRCTPWLLNK